MKKFALCAAAALIAVPAFADGSYGTDGNGLIITDDLYDGSLGSMVSLDVVVAGEAALADVNVTFDIDHTWVGDLVIKLESPDGTITTLMSRPGFAEPGDDGTGCCGTSSDAIFGNTYTFDDAAGTSSEDFGTAGDPIPSGSWNTGGGLDALNGIDANGTWTLYIGDSAGGDEGIFDGFTLDIVSVPAPGALALLGAAGLVARRRRRA